MKDQIRILIGYDRSSCADAALDDLKRAGLPRNAEALILTVSEIWLPSPSSPQPVKSVAQSSANRAVSQSTPQRNHAAAAEPVTELRAGALDAKARLQSQFPAWEIRAEEVYGSPAREILRKADELKPHLIVVGSQGRTALGRFLLGSVSQKVLNEACCTVRVSRGTAWKDGSPVRILIGLDGTPSSEFAVGVVASRVWPTGSAVRLIAVDDPTGSEPGPFPSHSKKASATNRGTKREWIETFMKQATKRLRATQLSVSTRIDEGDPKRILIADAEEWGADCVFLGASGADRSSERFLLGSVSTAVVGRVHCSVEVVRSGY